LENKAGSRHLSRRREAMYYVIERKHVDTEAEANAFQRLFCIATQPARERETGNTRIEGSLGTTQSGVAEYAHGEFETIEDARNVISDITGGDYQAIGPLEEGLDTSAVSIVETYRFGTLPALSDHITRDMTRDLAQTDVFPTTSDGEIEELADDYVEEIRTGTLAEPERDTVVSMLKAIRNEKMMDEESQDQD
jgi:hypothetical protein